MKWKRKGLIYAPDGSSTWAKHSALQPTPLVTDNGIRVYLGFRDEKGVSRVGYVDIDANNPKRVLNVSRTPALDVGEPGTFDSNGVVPTAIVKRGHELYLYYAGYQIPSDVRFLVFGGLAVSRDGGKTFARKSLVPVMDRTDNELLFRVPHSVMYDDHVWKCWYGGGSHFVQGKKKTLPVYDVRYIESSDGIQFGPSGRVCLTMKDNEHRVGRPYVLKHNGIYKMFYGYGTEETIYRLGYAESSDGVDWVRKDHEMGIDVSAAGWDSQMMAYPAIVIANEKTILFYNGNDMGRTGFGYAELLEW